MITRKQITLFFTYLFSAFTFIGYSQELPANISKILKENPYVSPKEYILGKVTFRGLTNYSPSILLSVTKLNVGERMFIPSEHTSNAIKYLWQQNLFQDIRVEKKKLVGDTLHLEFIVKEIPKLGQIKIIQGVRKGEVKELKEKLDDLNGKILNENLKKTIRQKLHKHYLEKGFYFVDISIENVESDIPAQEDLEIMVTKNKKTRVNKFTLKHNSSFKNKRLIKWSKVKDLSKFRIFKPGKFKEKKFKEGKENIIKKLHALGYRDAHIKNDNITKATKGNINIDMDLHVGKKYYFGDISWDGNAIYPDYVLNSILQIKKGDVYSEERLNKKLSNSAQSDDVSSLYTNNGYLTFNIRPEVSRIYQDSISLNLKVFEGLQYTNSKIVLRGNNKTNDYVILREIRTLPGQKFSKDLLVRSHREISQLGFIDEKTIDINPKPNPNNGTVDIYYDVQEKSADQIEFSISFAANRAIGSIGLKFNNFSIQDIFNGKAYKPLPFGNGQKFSIRSQFNGTNYQSYSMNFSDPWFLGKKPLNFGVSLYMSNYFGTREIGGSVSLGRRLKWPDDYFQISHAISVQNVNYDTTRFNFGVDNTLNINFSQVISRNSLDALIFPTSGSHIRITMKSSPPYSLLTGYNYANRSNAERYKLTEFYKFKLDYQWFQNFVSKFVFKTQFQFGLVGFYNKDIGFPVLERFRLGGDGLQGFDTSLRSLELVTLRGYEQASVIPNIDKNSTYIDSGSPIYSRMVFELRYPVALSQGATVYLTSFFEAGNTWAKFSNISPFNLRRSVGIGARIFLPIFGMVGIDYAYGLDEIPGYPNANDKRFNFSIVQQLGAGFD